MKNRNYTSNVALPVVLGAFQLVCLLVRTFNPMAVLPRLDVPMVVLLSLAALLAAHYLTKGREACDVVSLALAAFNFDVGPDPGFTLTSTASCNYTRYRSDDMNDLLGQLRKSVTPDDYQHAMSLIQDQFEQDMPYICLYWRAGALLSRNAFTDARDIRELELLRGAESFGR